MVVFILHVKTGNLSASIFETRFLSYSNPHFDINTEMATTQVLFSNSLQEKLYYKTCEKEKKTRRKIVIKSKTMFCNSNLMHYLIKRCKNDRSTT